MPLQKITYSSFSCVSFDGLYKLQHSLGFHLGLAAIAHSSNMSIATELEQHFINLSLDGFFTTIQNIRVQISLQAFPWKLLAGVLRVGLPINPENVEFRLCEVFETERGTFGEKAERHLRTFSFDALGDLYQIRNFKL